MQVECQGRHYCLSHPALRHGCPRAYSVANHCLHEPFVRNHLPPLRSSKSLPPHPDQDRTFMANKPPQYPVSFIQQRGWSLGVAQLPFPAFIAGVILGAGIIAYSTRAGFTRSYIRHGKAIPEDRLPPMIFGAIILPIGLFMSAWTSNPHMTWVPQLIATGLTGAGIMVPFWQGTSYMIDCYGFYSNSAMAFNTFSKSFAGAFFPFFTNAMYEKLGAAGATSLMRFCCLAVLPVPVLFYVYGAKIRSKSKWIPTTRLQTGNSRRGDLSLS